MTIFILRLRKAKRVIIMIFEAMVIKDKSLDPYFLIKFSYKTDEVNIESGTAVVIRQAPKSLITYDEFTENKIDFKDRMHIEYGLLNTVIDYIFSNGVIKSWRGNIILKTA